jgi:AAA15 family ATPase/GTPase
LGKVHNQFCFMLKKITLENYRCFEKTEISFKELSIIVGKNNAGKSTLIEALRILSLTVNRCKKANYQMAPSWLNTNEDLYGIRPSLNNLEISPNGIIFMYKDGPAKIVAEFENNSKIIISINNESDLFAAIFDAKGMNVESRKFASTLRLPEINILRIPPVSNPFLKHS